MRRPGIEPGSQEWESCMIPLHQRRFHIKLTLMIDNKYGKNLFPAILKKKLSLILKYTFVRTQKCGTLHDFACHPCAGAMLIFSVSFQF